MADGYGNTKTATSAVSGHSSAAENPIQALQWGTSSDISYNAAGGAVVTGGPYSGLVLRLAVNIVQGATGIRVARGGSAAEATANLAPGCLIPGTAIDHILINNGDYLAVISNDSSAGAVNVTVAT